LHAANAAHAAVGTPVSDAPMRTLDGGSVSPLSDAQVSVLVFFRPEQARSTQALRDLAQCQQAFRGKSVRWVGLVSDAVSAPAAQAMARESGFAAPVLVDAGDVLYGSLGIALHPVVVLVGADRKLAAFEAFRSIDFCTVVAARIRFALHEITEAQLREALEPPRATEGGDAHAAARRYLSLAQAQQRAGHADKACESVRRSLERDPGLAAALELMRELASSGCKPAAPNSDSK
jgi:hypothetical protein